MIYDYIIVGGGIGGVASYILLKSIGKNVLLFEKLNYLGGCAGTFEKDGYLYNVGASTLVGLEENMPLNILLKIARKDKKELPVKPIDPSIVVFAKDKVIKRYKDKQKAFEEINKSFYHKNNKILWDKIYKTADTNWESLYKLIPFNPNDKIDIVKKFFLNCGYFCKNGLKLIFSAKDVIKSYIPDISKDYIDFLNSQILMTSQGYWDEVSFSIASMGLTYPNLDNYYVFGGINQILEVMVKDEKNIKRKDKVIKISKDKDIFKILSKSGEYYSKKVILNKTIWDFCEILDNQLKDSICEKNIKKYNKIWSSATLYFNVKDDKNILNEHHYQIIHEKNPYTGSYSFFLSVSDKDDNIMNKDGFRSITISTHCKIDLWENLTAEEYKEKKEMLKDFILKKLYEKLPFFKNLEIKNIMVGTPKTFKRYTERYKGTVGGIPLLIEYTMLNYPSGITPINGLYIVGDSVFPGQGFPGVILGVFNIISLIERDFSEIFYKYIS